MQTWPFCSHVRSALGRGSVDMGELCTRKRTQKTYIEQCVLQRFARSPSKVRILQYDTHVFAAQFQQHRLQLLRSGRSNGPSDARGAGEVNFSDRLMAYADTSNFDRILRAVKNEVAYASRAARPPEQASDKEMDSR